MAPKGIPLSPDQRRGLFEWVLAAGAEEVATQLESSKDSIANWLAGLCNPFAIAHRVIARKLTARRDETVRAIREAARLLAT